MGCGSSSVNENKKVESVNINDACTKVEEIKGKYPDNCCA